MSDDAARGDRRAAGDVAKPRTEHWWHAAAHRKHQPVDALMQDRPVALGALYAASALLRIGAAGTGVAVQFDLTDIARGRPHGWIIGAVGAMQAVTEMIFAPVLARYADRFGRTRFLVGGPLLSVIGSILLAVSVHPRQIGEARLLEGIGAAAFVPTALGIIAAATTTSRLARARASGAFEACTLIGYAGGFVAGPLAYYQFHRAGFLLLGGLYLIASLVCLRFVPTVPPLPVSPLRDIARAVLKRGPIRSFLPAWIAANALVLAFATNLPALLKRDLVPGQTIVHHFDERVIALLLVIWVALFILGIALWTPVVARLGAAVTMRRAVPAAWLICAGLFAINHTSIYKAPFFLLPVALGVVGLAGFGPAALTYLAECSEAYAADRSALMAFYTVTLAGGGALGAFLGGLAVNWLLADGLIVLGLGLSGFAFLSLRSVVRHEREMQALARGEEAPGLLVM